ncbi:Pro-kumamolisin, activation domain-containing protein [Pterulicium gracile]|uniref:Pro-kumamolisin, activation domain-containing protein n=1 Tax=Pterulicium gracile TaxID=1884261 RepID=A0A5C3QLX3_9AGAR|nr:Pro-kumamolisin, activation domain-containing protein [Pterula gracilis]
MISSRFILLATLISTALANPLLPQQRSDLPEGFNAVGSPSQDESITFRIALTQRDFPGLEKALYAAATPGSPQYGQYLSKDQVNDYASPSEEAVASVSSWLESQGLSPSSLSPSGDWITVQATVRQANRLLQAEFKRYEAEGLDGPVVRTLSYTIPDMVKDHIAAMHPTTADEGNAIPPSCVRGSDKDPVEITRPYSLPCRFDLYGIPYTALGSSVEGNDLWMSGYNNGFANKNLTKAYLQDWRPELVDRDMFGLVTITGGLNNQIPGGAGLFVTAAVTTAMSTAVNTPVTFMSVGTDKSDDALVWFIDQANYLLGLDSPPKVLVGDWPLSEFFEDAALARSLCNSYGQLAARGVTILFPTQSHGVGLTTSTWPGSQCPKFYSSFPASCPYVTAVGASSISDDSTSEEVDPRNSGGFSELFSRPAYQDAAVPRYLEALETGIYDGLYNPSGRGTPDVALHQYWAMTPEDGYGIGSTSFSVSFFGSIIALLNEELLSAGKPHLGFLNPFIYQNLDAFNDFITGNNPGCGTQGFNATTGWDPVSGAGSPNYAKLRAAVGL